MTDEVQDAPTRRHRTWAEIRATKLTAEQREANDRWADARIKEMQARGQPPTPRGRTD